MYGELPPFKTADGGTINGFPVVIPKPRKTAVLRLPTNAEMCDYLRKEEVIYTDLGRRTGKSEPVPQPQADLDLFKLLCLSSTGEPFDEAEALFAIQRITSREVVSCQREGEIFRIKLKTPFGFTEHFVEIPSQRDLTLYRRTVYRPIQLPHNRERRQFPPEAPITLYDAVAQSIDGYAPAIKAADVPPHHKSSVVYELVQAYGEELDRDLDPNLPNPEA